MGDEEAINENTVEVNTMENEVEEKSENINFKKPVLIGKIGRLPKKLNSVPKKSVANIQNSLSKEYDSNLCNNVQTSELENETQKTDSSILQYIEPKWSGMPRSVKPEYNFEVLKDGAIIDTINLINKSYWVFGRLPNCDICMQHPTISRYHAVLQYRSEESETEEPGFYIYDLASTHGTFLNKNRCRPRTYVRIQVGHMLKLGCSSRNYLLNGPEEDTEKESELTVTELKQKRREDLERIENERMEKHLAIQRDKEEKERKEEERGIDWGMGDDADEEADLSENPYAQTTNEDLYLDDPKKTLRGYFEREGLELEYDCSEQGMGQFMCKVELPIDDERGRPIFAEIIHRGKKKDAVVQCALEACRILDRHGLLRQAQHESRKRKVKDWAENDYYDSDDDTFLDRTGTIEKKREKRMNAKVPRKAETYESLLKQEQQLSESIKTLERQLIDVQQKSNSTNNTSLEEDSLDAFMKDLKDSKPDKITINKLKSEIAKLKQEHGKIIKLVNLARPASLPPLVPQYNMASAMSKSKGLPIFGKRKKVPVSVPQKTTNDTVLNIGVIEQEEEDNDDSVDTLEKFSSRDHDLTNEPQMKTEELQISTNNECKVTEEKSEFGLRIPNQIIENDSHNSVIKRKTNSSSSNTNFHQSLLDECQCTVNSLFENFKQSSSKILSEEQIVDKEMICQKLLSMVKEGVNEISNNIDAFVGESEQGEIENKIKSPEPNLSIKLDTKKNSTDQSNKKNKNQRRIQHRQEKAEMDKEKGYQEDARKEDYNMWIPPSDQKGDGKTKLNEKYGY
ncbi:hypothetical protein HHI36_011718 [Cryptolaemus montrouzieri]|uniref:FHA domain-containing protein n=1 Tax=Cryptolaemus montrouzieri TaxID=559131 RepID=A0ABD2ND40_9CUCU